MDYYVSSSQNVVIMSAVKKSPFKSTCGKPIMHHNMDERGGRQGVNKNGKELQMAQYHGFQWHAKDFSHCIRGHSISRCNSQMRCNHEQQIALSQYGIKQSRPWKRGLRKLKQNIRRWLWRELIERWISGWNELDRTSIWLMLRWINCWIVLQPSMKKLSKSYKWYGRQWIA